MSVRTNNGFCSGIQEACTSWASQVWCLLKKNAVLFLYNWKLTAALVFSPIVFLCFLWIAASQIPTDADSSNVTSFLKCQRFGSNSELLPEKSVDAGMTFCKDFAYAPNTDTLTNQIASQMEDQFDLRGMGFSTEAAMAAYAFANPGVFDTAINFATPSSADVAATADFQSFDYHLVVNQTAYAAYSERAVGLNPLRRFNFDGRLFGYHVAVQSAILGVIGQLTGVPSSDTPNIAITIARLASVKASIVANRAVGLLGSLLIVSGAAVTMLVVINAITHEKQNDLLGTMRMLGLRESAYWLSWLISFVFIMFFSVLIMVAIGRGAGLTVFTHCDFSVHLVTMFSFFICFMSFTFWIAALVSRPRWVNIVCLLLLLVAVGSTLVINQVSDGIADKIMDTWKTGGDSEGTSGQNVFFFYHPDATVVASSILQFFPWYHYAHIFSDILRRTSSSGLTSSPLAGGAGGGEGSSMDSNMLQQLLNATHTNTGAPSDRFTWDDMFVSVPVKESSDDNAKLWTPPTVSNTLSTMVWISALYFFLTWYMSQVFAKQGSSQHWLFPFSPSYWGIRGKPILFKGDAIGEAQEKSRLNNSVVLHKLSKSFEKVTAVKEVSLEMESGSIVALLGHNGAGKTSIIKVLTGLYNPTHGEAFVFGKSVREDVQGIQSQMGICPQENWLWDQMSARQHMHFFAGFKRLPGGKALEEHIDGLLRDVNLLHKKGPSSSYSGGQKRRLLIALACIGNPRIIFLDEPTTGMDPLHRRMVWKTIQKRKINTVIVLTTHSMEEADALGDNIAIMSQGRLRANGTSMFLKRRFGTGYQINLLTNPEQVASLSTSVQSLLPGAEILDVAAGAMTIALPRNAVNAIPHFFRWVQANSSVVREWGLSDSTLEEVFIRLATVSKEVNASASGSADNEIFSTSVGEGGNAVSDGSHLCQLCARAPAEEVVLYTEDRLAVRVKDIVCQNCARGVHGDEAAAILTGLEANGGKHLPSASPPPPPPPPPSSAWSTSKSIASMDRSPLVSPSNKFFDMDEESHTGSGGGKVKQVSAKGVGGYEGAVLESTELVPASHLLLSQFKGIFLKDLSILGRQRKQNICQLLTLIVAIILTGTLFSVSKEDYGWKKLIKCPGVDWGFETYSFSPVSSEDELKMCSISEKVQAWMDPKKAQGLPDNCIGTNDKDLSDRIQTMCKSDDCNAKIAAAAKILTQTCYPDRTYLNRKKVMGGSDNYYGNEISFGAPNIWFEQADVSDGARLQGELLLSDLGLDLAQEVSDLVSQLYSATCIEPPTPPTPTPKPCPPEDKDGPVEPGCEPWFFPPPTPDDKWDGHLPRKRQDICLAPKCKDALPCGSGSSNNDWDRPDCRPDVRSLLEPYHVNLLKFGGNIDQAVLAAQEVLQEQLTAFKSAIGCGSGGWCYKLEDCYYDSSTDDILETLPSAADAGAQLKHALPDAAVRVRKLNKYSLSIDADLLVFLANNYYYGSDSGVYATSIYAAPDAVCTGDSKPRDRHRGVCPRKVTMSTDDNFLKAAYLFQTMVNNLLLKAHKSPPSMPTPPTTTAATAETTPTTNTASLLANTHANNMKRRQLLAPLASNKPFRISSTLSNFPEIKFDNNSMELGMRVGLLVLILFVTLMFLPQMMGVIVAEREDNLFHMLRISGMNPLAYWLATYSFYFIQFFIYSALFVGISVAVDAPAFKNAAPGLYFLVMIGWAHAQVAFAILVAAFISSKRVALAGSYVLLLFTVLLSVMLEYFSATSWPVVVLVLCPPMAFTRAISLLLSFGGSSVLPGSELALCVGLLYGLGTVYLLLGIYCQTLHYSDRYFLCEMLCPCFKKKMEHRTRTASMAGPGYRGSLNEHSVVRVGDGEEEDVDVREERMRVQAQSHEIEQLLEQDASARTGVVNESSAAVYISGLRKNYVTSSLFASCVPAACTPSSALSSSQQGQGAIELSAVHAQDDGNEGSGINGVKRAIRDLHLGIQFGETFGLLGTNGAGKSTTISVLSGLVAATAGVATVAGYSATSNKERSYLYRNLGVCPQFDTIWPDLSVRQTLYVYARVKGVREAAISAVVQRVASMVELDGDPFNMAASTLSGGMQRRLSIGISLIGNPAVWLLDEPTTGLDPETRRQVWDIIQRQKSKDRCIVVTTHAMEEADTLCTRIGIMKNGQLCCLGNQLHLKNRFGEGYKLTVALSVDAPHIRLKLDEFVQNKLCRTPVLPSPPVQLGKSRQYMLAREEVDIAACISVLEANKKFLGIDEWGLTQSSLEEVFIKVTKSAEDEKLLRDIDANI